MSDGQFELVVKQNRFVRRAISLGLNCFRILRLKLRTPPKNRSSDWVNLPPRDSRASMSSRVHIMSAA